MKKDKVPKKAKEKSTKKNSKERSDMAVIEIKPSNPKSFNLAGYQIIGMGGQGQQPKGKGKK